MNENMLNDSSSYSRRHTYTAHNKAESCRFDATPKRFADRCHKNVKRKDTKGVADNGVFKKTYGELVSSVTDKQALNKMIDKAAEWLEVDDKALRVEGVKKKIPTKLISGIIVISTSLMLIVAGAVISSKSNMELYASENRLEELRVVESQLDEALELKNDLVYIEDVARNKLGMIDREYGAVMYVDNDNNDRVEIYEKSTDTSAFHALLNALGFFEE